MTYLIWRIDDQPSLMAQLTQAAESFYTRTGTRATTLVVSPGDHDRFMAVGSLVQALVVSSAGTGIVPPGTFWMGVDR